MPVQFYNLGFNLFHADASQQIQNLHQQAARGGNEVAQFQAQDKAKEQQHLQVQTTEETENQEIQGDSRGAHSHTLTSEEEEEKKEETPPEPPPDPTGKGTQLDVSC